MSTLVVDRVEGRFAVVRDNNGIMQDIPLDRITGKVGSGYSLQPQESGMYAAVPPDADDTAAVRALFDSLK